MRRALASVVVAVFLLSALPHHALADDPPDTLTLLPLPDAARRCELVQLTMTTNGGHEYTEITASPGLRWVRSWYHHWGWDQSATPGDAFRGAAVSWAMDWKGPPTFEYEVVGDVGTEAWFEVRYQGGSWGEWRYATSERIQIQASSPQVDATELPLGAGPLVIDGRGSTRVRAVVHECGTPVAGATVRFTTDLGRLSVHPTWSVPYRAWQLRAPHYDYILEQAKSVSPGVTVVTDEDGVAIAFLTAHTPVIRETTGPRAGDVHLFSDPLGPEHGLPRPANVTASCKLGGVDYSDTYAVIMHPGTDLDAVFEELHWFRDVVAGLFGLADTPTLDAADPAAAELELLAGDGTSTLLSIALQRATLSFLDELRADPADAALLDGWDWAPIVAANGHRAVALYSRTGGWNDGYVLDLMWSSTKQAYTWLEWPVAKAGVSSAIDDADDLRDVYPATSGGRYPDTYPLDTPVGDFWERVLAADGAPQAPVIDIVTCSPVRPLLTDRAGRRSGLLPDGTVVAEIPGTVLMRLRSGTEPPEHLLEVRADEATLSLFGTDDGTFDLRAVRVLSRTSVQGSAWRGVPVRGGESLTAALTRKRLYVPLERAQGGAVQPAGSETFDKLRVKLAVRAPQKDSLRLKARWRPGELVIDPMLDPVVVSLGPLTFTIPAGAVTIRRNGVVTYRGDVSGGARISLRYAPRSGALSFNVRGLDLALYDEFRPLVSVTCDQSTACPVSLKRTKRGFVTKR